MKFKYYLKLLRAHHWIKNILIFAPLFFSFTFSFEKILVSLLAFLCFNLASSSIYIINDIMDVEKDKHHPVKKNRPIASGVISKKEAFKISLILMFIAISLSLHINTKFLFVIIIYITLNVLYSIYLKNQPIIDVASISASFILRLFAGSYATNINLSEWIILITLSLSMFMAFAKRLEDLELYKKDKLTRSVIVFYSENFLFSVILFTSILSVSLYVIFTVVEYGQTKLFITVIFVILGFIRYYYLIFSIKTYRDPISILLKDRFLQTIVFLWLISYYIIIKLE